MSWLAGVDRAGINGPVGLFCQMLAVSAPVGASEADVLVTVAGRHRSACHVAAASGRRRRGNLSLVARPAGSVEARGCLHAVAVLSDDALVQARSRLDPAGGVMLSALWVTSTAELVLVIHHLAVDAVSWRILVDDLNAAWRQYRATGAARLAMRGTSFRRWASLLDERARSDVVVDQLAAWRTIAAVGGVMPAAEPAGGYLRQRRTPVGVAGRRDHP